MAEVRLKAREAAYLRAFVWMALEMRIFRETIDDEAERVIGEAIGRIGRQLARLKYEDGPRVEDLLPLIFQPMAFMDLGLDLKEALRETFQQVH
ncbi:MAG: hypothetical protein WHT08_09035 [Bryobacteraceae bacterium]|jgi:hypothetical protein